MHKFPVTVLDNFFDTPDRVREFALKQEFAKGDGSWPGVRTTHLHLIDEDLFNFVCQRIIATFYNFEVEQVTWRATAMFQIVTKDSGAGWIHYDSPYILSAIIYLNPNPAANSGTSIYRPKDGVVIPVFKNLKDKEAANLGKVSLDSVITKREENNSQFTEVIRVSNDYNRMICFDSNLIHAANDFFGDSSDEGRLTLVVFFNQIDVGQYPVDRVKSSFISKN